MTLLTLFSFLLANLSPLPVTYGLAYSDCETPASVYVGGAQALSGREVFLSPAGVVLGITVLPGDTLFVDDVHGPCRVVLARNTGADTLVAGPSVGVRGGGVRRLQVGRGLRGMDVMGRVR